MILYNNKEVIPKYNGNDLLKILKNGIILWEGIGDIPPASAYIQDGLVFHLDGIERGDDETAWTDLIGGKKFTLYNCTLNDDNVEFNGTSSYGQDPGYGTLANPDGAIEAVFTTDNFNTTSDVEVDVFYAGYSDSTQIHLIKSSGKEAIGIHKSAQYKNPLNNLKMVSGNKSTNDCVINGIRNPHYSVKSLSRSTGGIMYVGGKSKGYLKGKVYTIRCYNRSLTTEERLHNQLLDIQRFKLPDNFETVKLTLVSNDGGSVAGAKFMIGGSLCEYSGNTMTFKIPAGTYYQLNFSCIPNYRAPEGTEIFKAVAGETRNITLVYTYNGFEDYFVTTGNYVDSNYITEDRDGVTYYKNTLYDGITLNIDESVTSIEHWSQTYRPGNLNITGPKNIAPFINEKTLSLNTVKLRGAYSSDLLFPKAGSTFTPELYLDFNADISQIGNLNQYAVLNLGTCFNWSVQSGTWTSSSVTYGKERQLWTCKSPGNGGSTVIRCTFKGVTSITFYCDSNGEDGADYLTVGSLDTPCTRTSYNKKFDATNGSVTYKCDEGEHYVEFCYSKDRSYSASPDNATVYVSDYVSEGFLNIKNVITNTYSGFKLPVIANNHNIYINDNNYSTTIRINPDYKSTKFNFVNLTHSHGAYTYDFSYITYDSTASEELKESFRKSLVVNSLDRTGLATGASFKMYDSANINYILTDDEIAQITAKGYTIA